MTFSEDFIPYENGKDGGELPTYPTAFGITLTPAVSGALIAVLGLGGAFYLLLNLLMPTLQRHQELKASQEQKQALVAQKEASLQQVEKIETELVQAKQQKTEILGLFANESTLDTLLLDLNRLVESSNTNPRQDTKARLQRFVPQNQSAEVITDGSLGSEVNGKLKRRVINIELTGSFEQTQSIIRNIERLQPLLIVKDYQSTVAPATADKEGKIVTGPANITTSFQLQALIPLSPEEAAQSAAATEPPKQ